MGNTEFSLEVNRSERAKQVELLAPLLWNNESRQELLLSLNNKLDKVDHISEKEADKAKAFHFVWVLRDSFFCERKKCEESKEWDALIERWSKVLKLSDWAREPLWWRHPEGSYGNDSEYIVHPCNRAIGWTKQGIGMRIRNKPGIELESAQIKELIEARKVMNTECDCFIQTSRRLIVIECKDKTGFIGEQKARQDKLSECIKRLIPREAGILQVDISPQNRNMETEMWWSWKYLKELNEKYGMV